MAAIASCNHKRLAGKRALVALVCVTLPQLRLDTSRCAASTFSITGLTPRRSTIAALISSYVAPSLARAEQAATSASSARLAVVETYPAMGNLVPLYGIFDLARLTSSAASDSSKLPTIRKRFEQIADSDLDAYRFLTTQYIANIKYADPDEKVVNFDKAARYKAVDDAMSAVARTKKLLQGKELSEQGLQSSVSEIGKNLANFFSLLPKEDTTKAEGIASDLRSRDINKDGRLSDEELQTLGSGQLPLTDEVKELVSSLSKLGLRNLLVP
eukprot:TRINITY_DN77603_c0_g1_i1.p1 TRINITY_DN77603_c0_g1~~TRINITY_DN77603_c0_g1_i1.p1  ORF type:complete len:271 (+),score=51.53 TRINITY_DN77603_c0_g1_i1:103-915(+)